MAVFRIQKTQNYTVMSNYHFKEKEMSLKSKGLLSLMLSLPDTWNYTISGLCTLSKDGKDSIMSALGELEKFGYLHRERTKNETGQFSGIVYHIFEEPRGEIPFSENPILENPISEKQNSENQPQLSTKELSTKDLNKKELITKRVGFKKNKSNSEMIEELKRMYQEIEERENG